MFLYGLRFSLSGRVDLHLSLELPHLELLLEGLVQDAVGGGILVDVLDLFHGELAITSVDIMVATSVPLLDLLGQGGERRRRRRCLRRRRRLHDLEDGLQLWRCCWSFFQASLLFKRRFRLRLVLVDVALVPVPDQPGYLFWYDILWIFDELHVVLVDRLRR